MITLLDYASRLYLVERNVKFSSKGERHRSKPIVGVWENENHRRSREPISSVSSSVRGREQEIGFVDPLPRARIGF